MGKLYLLLFLSLPVLSQDQDQNRAWKLSVAAAATGTILDVQSSWGGYELNPVVGRGIFGVRQTVAVSVVTAGVMAFEYLLLRKHHRYARVLTWTNYIVAGAHTGAAVRNWRH